MNLRIHWNKIDIMPLMDFNGIIFFWFPLFLGLTWAIKICFFILIIWPKISGVPGLFCAMALHQSVFLYFVSADFHIFSHNPFLRCLLSCKDMKWDWTNTDPRPLGGIDLRYRAHGLDTNTPGNPGGFLVWEIHVSRGKCGPLTNTLNNNYRMS